MEEALPNHNSTHGGAGGREIFRELVKWKF
jgi:hypothetical protein